MAIASKPTPTGWPRISSCVVYRDPHAAIDFLVRVFGFEVRLKVEEGGEIHHCELVIGDGMIMLGGATKERPHLKSPREVDGANTQALMVFVDDADAHCAHVRAAGATIHSELKTSDYGDDYWTDRSYEAIDLEGHHWWFTQRMKG